MIEAFHLLQKVPWNRGRITLLGESASGKTSLAKSIQGEVFDAHLKSTIGIEKSNYDILAGNKWTEIQTFSEMEVNALQYLQKAVTGLESNSSMEQTSPETVNQLNSGNTINNIHSEGKEESLPLSSTIPHPTKPDTIKSIDTLSLYTCLCDNLFDDTQMKISLFDFAGQIEFKIIHSLFLTKYGIYIIVFNMEHLVNGDGNTKENELQHLRIWWNSVIAHTMHYDEQGNASTAPIVFVGTRKDSVGDPRKHDMISDLLQKEFSQSIGWKNIIRYDLFTGEGVNMSLTFFPVNNVAGKDDPVIQELKVAVKKSILSSPTFIQEVPLTWLRVLDDMKEKKIQVIPHDDFLSYVKEHYSSLQEEQSVTEMLLHFHSTGSILFLQEPSFFDLIIFDPVEFFIKPASRIICNLEHERIANQLSASQQQARNNSTREMWSQYVNYGILTLELLEQLLSDQVYRREIIFLMINFHFIIPVNVSKSLTNKSYFLVPSLFTQNKEMSLVQPYQNVFRSSYVKSPPPVSINHFEPISNFQTKFTFYFGFVPISTKAVGDPNDGNAPYFAFSEMKEKCISLLGIFQHLVGKAVSICSHIYSLHELKQVVASFTHTTAYLNFGDQIFRLTEHAPEKLIQVDIDGNYPLPVYLQLKKILESLLSFYNKTKENHQIQLVCLRPWQVNFGNEKSSDSNANLVPIRSFTDFIYFDICRLESILKTKGNSFTVNIPQFDNDITNWTELDYDEIKEFCGPFVSNQLFQDDQVSFYDLFLSYNWNFFDSQFVDELWTEISLFNVYHRHADRLNNNITLTEDRKKEVRHYEVFYDKQHIDLGMNFRDKFVHSLLHSAVLVPIISFDALSKLQTHDPLIIDNLCLEWALIYLLHKSYAYKKESSRHLKVEPAQNQSPDFKNEVEAILHERDDLIIIPILIGKLETVLSNDPQQADTNGKRFIMKDLFSEKIVPIENNIIPHSTLACAIKTLQDYNLFYFPAEEAAKLSAITISTIVNELLLFQAINSYRLYEEYSEENAKSGGNVAERDFFYGMRSNYCSTDSQEDNDSLQKPSGESSPAIIELKANRIGDFFQFLISSCSKRLLDKLKDVYSKYRRNKRGGGGSTHQRGKRIVVSHYNEDNRTTDSEASYPSCSTNYYFQSGKYPGNNNNNNNTNNRSSVDTGIEGVEVDKKQWVASLSVEESLELLKLLQDRLAEEKKGEDVQDDVESSSEYMDG
jgi:GTPase SAR1 family protein